MRILLLCILFTMVSAQECNTKWTHVTDYDGCLEAARWARGNGTFGGYVYTQLVDRYSSNNNYPYCLPEDSCYSDTPGPSNYWKWYVENGAPSTVSLDGETYTFKGCYKYNGNGEKDSGGNMWSVINWINGTLISGYKQGQFDEVVKFEDGTYGFKPDCTCSTGRDNGFFLVNTAYLRRDDRVTKELCEKYAISVGARFWVKSDSGVRGCVAYPDPDHANARRFAWTEDNDNNVGSHCDHGGDCVYMRDKCDRCMPGYSGPECTVCGDNQYNDYVTTVTGLVDTTMSSYDCLVYSTTVGHEWERMINEADSLRGCFVIEHANNLNSVYFNLDNVRQGCDSTTGQKCITKVGCADCKVGDEHKIIDECKEYTDSVLNNTGTPDISVTQEQCMAMGASIQNFSFRPSGCYVRTEGGIGVESVYNTADTNVECHSTTDDNPGGDTYCVQFDDSTRSDCPAGSAGSYVLNSDGINDNSMTQLECREYATVNNIAFYVVHQRWDYYRPRGCYWRTGYEVVFNIAPSAYFNDCRSGGAYINSTQCIQKKCDVCLHGYGNKGSGCELCNITEFNAVESSSDTTCNKKVCPIGFGAPKLDSWDASHVDHESNDCVPCPVGQYSSSADEGQCSICSKPTWGQEIGTECTSTNDTVIRTCADDNTIFENNTCTECAKYDSEQAFCSIGLDEEMAIGNSYNSSTPNWLVSFTLSNELDIPLAERRAKCKRLCEAHPQCAHYQIYSDTRPLCTGGILKKTNPWSYGGNAYIEGLYRVPSISVLGPTSDETECATLCENDPTCNYFSINGGNCYKTKDCNKMLRPYVENNTCQTCSDIPPNNIETKQCGATDRTTQACNTSQYVENNTCQTCSTVQLQPGQIMWLPCIWSTDAIIQTCSSGKYTFTGSTNYDSECRDCAAGKYSSEGASQCTHCSAGQYQDATGGNTCKVCSPGTYSGEGADVCTSCTTGRYQSDEGQSECVYHTTCASNEIGRAHV